VIPSAHGAVSLQEATIPVIPLQLKGTYTSNDGAIRNFCRNYSQVISSNRQRNTYEERIVDRAYQSLDQCLALAATGAIIHQNIQTLARVDFFLTPGRTPIKVMGINTTLNVKCTGMMPNSNQQTATQFDASTSITLQGSDALGMVCTREPRTDSSGNQVYDEGAATVLTDVVPNGNYTMYMPRDARLPENLASSINSSMATLIGQNLALIARLTAAELKLDAAKAVEATELSYRGSYEGAPRGKADGTTELGGFAELYHKCPAGSFMVAIELLKVGQNVAEIRYQCRSIFD
jgi:hypothetical protein